MLEVRCRKSGLMINEQICNKCDYLKRCITQDKIAKTKATNNALDNSKIAHFGVWLKVRPTLKISRENYAIIDKRNTFWRKTHMFWSKYFYQYPGRFEDESCRTYTDEYCQQHQTDCIANYDVNMNRFENIPRERFEGVINHLLNSAPLQQIDDLSRCNCCGIYIMVLDQYKQLYIGKARNIKDRIKQHWNKTKEFDRLLYGTVKNSILSIDSFGALDTTRIFILPMPLKNLDEAEKGFLDSINSCYTLNRIDGGLNSLLEIMCLSNDRCKITFNKYDCIPDFLELPKKKQKNPVREKYIKSVEYKNYTEGEKINFDDILIGSVICIQHNNKKYWGKVMRETAHYITICKYGEGNKLELSLQQIVKQEKNFNNEKRFSKKCIQRIFNVNETSNNVEKVFWKVVAHKEIDLWK